MLAGSKEEHDLYISQAIKNLVKEETSFNLVNREAFSDWMGVYGYIKEELEEASEALVDTAEEHEKLWRLIRNNAYTPELVLRTQVLVETALEIIHEAVHVAAVGMKAIEQLGGDPFGKRQEMD
ncbi:hypothetical protein CS063_01390 [Sporanaerobium hydrogeniformans]|uniref:Uncharacterized protein n=1 Tax=Sporanaerobium hydrogeniformans TaxID=3072179 RepID=A0AC61DIT8_9FIRM|nr:hypothetical protein [Sporanaerobium hydrogeniformans]PHV72157.1 hypothetical protein CS063_01390 [Sporanaerobium hydrogeniformans]